MVRSVRSATLVSTLGLMALYGVTSTAMASGFALREESAEGLGTVFAGSAAKAYNVNTVYYNPAGMSRLNETEVAGTVTWIAPTAKFSGSNTNPIGGTMAGSQPKDAIKDAAVGSLFGAMKLNDRWHVGLSIAVPYGMRSEYKEDWVGKYQALASDVTDIDYSAVASYKVNDHLSVGGGPRLSYLTARLTQAVDFQAIGLGKSVPGAAGFTTDGGAKVEGSDYAMGYNLGALYQFDPGTRVGIDYRSRVNHELQGQASYQSVPTALASAFTTKNATSKMTLPDSINLSGYHELNDKWAVMSTLEWTHWSLFNHLGVVATDGSVVSDTQENWRNTWFVSLGTNYKATDKLTLHTGVAFDETPVKNAYRTARIPDSNRYWVSFGASYSVMPNTDVHFGYAHLFAPDATIHEQANSASGVLSGKYENKADIVSASLAVKF